MFATISVVIVIAIQTAIAFIEMFLWKKEWVYKRLNYEKSVAEKVAPIVANAGLYNGFIAAGLIYGLTNTGTSHFISFFLTCVVIAGIFGVTLKWTTLVIQALPAGIALACVWSNW